MKVVRRAIVRVVQPPARVRTVDRNADCRDGPHQESQRLPTQAPRRRRSWRNMRSQGLPRTPLGDISELLLDGHPHSVPDGHVGVHEMKSDLRYAASSIGRSRDVRQPARQVPDRGLRARAHHFRELHGSRSRPEHRGRRGDPRSGVRRGPRTPVEQPGGVDGPGAGLDTARLVPPAHAPSSPARARPSASPRRRHSSELM
jgi:hypothetical protein